MRLGKHGAGEERICSKAGDEKGKSPCVSRVEPTLDRCSEGGWRVGQRLGRPWCQLGLRLERNGNQGKPLTYLSRMVGSGLHSTKSFWLQAGDSTVGQEWEQVAR